MILVTIGPQTGSDRDTVSQHSNSQHKESVA